jgi:hypothetical protein
MYHSGWSGSRNGVSTFIQALPRDVLKWESVGMWQGLRSSWRKRALFGPKSRSDRDGLQDFPWDGKPSFQESLHKKGDMSAAQDAPSGIEFSPGDKVRHPAFGPGVVSRFISDDKVEVLFRNVGRKLLHLAYTTLEKV